MLRPFTMCAAQTPPDTSASHDAYGRLKTIVAFFPDAATDLMSSQPVRVMMLFFGSTLTCHVARKSAPVTGRAVAPDRVLLELDRHRQRVALQQLRLAGEVAENPLRVRVPDLTAEPDVVHDEARRVQTVADEPLVEVRRLLVVDEDDRAGGGSLRARGGGRPHDERERRRSPQPATATSYVCAWCSLQSRLPWSRR